MSELLKISNMYKIYGNNTKNAFEAISDVSFDIHEGEFICIMGPSGSGKSTFINCISTIDFPTKGTVKIKGESVTKMSEFEIGKFRYANLGFIFQNFNMMDALSVYDNISIPLTLAGVDKKEIDDRVKLVATELNVESLLDKYPTECSGGQCQRIAIARALINNPSLIIADEPTGNLDSKNSHDVLNILKDLNENKKSTIIMVTHDAMTASYSNKVLFIIDGKIQEVINRDKLSQEEYFNTIVKVNSKESLGLL